MKRESLQLRKYEETLTQNGASVSIEKGGK